MSRRISTVDYEAAGGPAADTYFDKVVKYIPADIVGAWIAVTGLIVGAAGVPGGALLWIAFAVAIILTAAWTWKQTTVPDQPPAVTQVVISTIAFIVWVFALGGPFATLGFYRPLYGSLLLILYTLLVALINPTEGG